MTTAPASFPSHTSPSPEALMATRLVEATGQDGERTTYAAHTLVGNLGSKPVALNGLEEAGDGYCPAEYQHKRIRVAGDLRSARFQRIATAQGSGAEAVLSLFYDNVEHTGSREEGGR
jgi:hypothetical protein